MLSIDKSAEDAKCEDLIKVVIRDDPKKFFQIGSQLPYQERKELIEFLKQNIDVFAWNTYKAPGVDLEFICHHLNVNPLIAPRSSPLDAHPKNMSKQSERRSLDLSKPGLSRKFSILNG